MNFNVPPPELSLKYQVGGLSLINPKWDGDWPVWVNEAASTNKSQWEKEKMIMLLSWVAY